jgi:transposase
MVPQDHLVRKIDQVIDFNFIYKLVENLYSEDSGRPAIDPVVLFKIPFIQYVFGIRSMRQTIEEIRVNTAYRWFLGLSPTDEVPHYTTFGKNYVRRFSGTAVFEEIFARILRQAVESGYVKPEDVFIDGTHVKASANKNKRLKVVVEEESRLYAQQLEEEINQLRTEEGKAPYKKKEQPGKEIQQSTTDPEAGLFYKNERERMFCYSASTACDRNGFVLGLHISAGNMHDSRNFVPLYDQLKERFEKIESIVADAGYVTPHIAKYCFDHGTVPVLPYKRPMTRKGYFRKHEYAYDEYYDCYLCPRDQVLSYQRTDRDGYRMYTSDPKYCCTCPDRERCTQSRNHTKVITRHIWAAYLEEANHLRHTPSHEALYTLRSQTIERVFADYKEKHGMRYTQYRGLSKVRDEAWLAFTCMNMKKLANWSWRRVA